MRPREPASAPTPALESGEKSENPSSEGSWESRRGGRRVFDSVDDTRPSTRGLRGKLPRDAAEHVGNSASGRSAAVQGDDTAGVGSEKQERRRQQLREASRRHRMRKRSAAQKTENELKQRTAEVNALRSELERHQHLLRSSVASQDQTLRSQVAQLQHQNEELQRENQTLRAALPDGRLTKDLLHILRAPLEVRCPGATALRGRCC